MHPGMGGHVVPQPPQLCPGGADLAVQRIGTPAVPDVPAVVQPAVDRVGHVLGAEVVDVSRGVVGVVLVIARDRVRAVLERSPGRVVPLRVVRPGTVGVGVVARREHRVGIRILNETRSRGGLLLVARDVPGPHQRHRPSWGCSRSGCRLRRHGRLRRSRLRDGALHTAGGREQHSRHEGRQTELGPRPGAGRHGVVLRSESPDVRERSRLPEGLRTACRGEARSLPAQPLRQPFRALLDHQVPETAVAAPPQPPSWDVARTRTLPPERCVRAP